MELGYVQVIGSNFLFANARNVYAIYYIDLFRISNVSDKDYVHEETLTADHVN